MKKSGWLAASTFALWALLIYPAWRFWGEIVWVQSLVALGLCLAPAMVTLAWVLHADLAPDRQLVAVLGGSGIRMGVSLGGGLLAYKTMPELFTNSFWLWMMLFYMFILVMETFTVLSRSRAGEGTGHDVRR